MKFDIFFSITQNEVNGFTPSETVMFNNFFDQVQYADQLGFGTAWIAETHLSCEIQKQNPRAVIPDFQGEIGLNTDVLQMAHKIFALTKNINVGSAIRNIICNGGPLAHAEAIRTFLALHGLDPAEKRVLELGFAAGRFDFSNRPYGVLPRSNAEQMAWPVIKTKAFHAATEIFLRALRGDVFASAEIAPMLVRAEDFRSTTDWQAFQNALAPEEAIREGESLRLKPFWNFEKVQVIPRDIRPELLRLTIGTHDEYAQELANRFLPVGVFNLSITPSEQIERTHERMRKMFNPSAGAWNRQRMPRTVLVFLNNDPKLDESARNREAKARAGQAIAAYWRAMEGTLDNRRVESAVNNALVGSAKEILSQLKARFNPEDRLMLWFDFNNHDSDAVMNSMRDFMESVAPEL